MTTSKLLAFNVYSVLYNRTRQFYLVFYAISPFSLLISERREETRRETKKKNHDIKDILAGPEPTCYGFSHIQELSIVHRRKNPSINTSIFERWGYLNPISVFYTCVMGALGKYVICR